MTGKASNGSFVICDLGQLPWSVYSCADSPVSDTVEIMTWNLFHFTLKKKFSG